MGEDHFRMLIHNNALGTTPVPMQHIQSVFGEPVLWLLRRTRRVLAGRISPPRQVCRPRNDRERLPTVGK